MNRIKLNKELKDHPKMFFIKMILELISILIVFILPLILMGLFSCHHNCHCIF